MFVCACVRAWVVCVSVLLFVRARLYVCIQAHLLPGVRASSPGSSNGDTKSTQDLFTFVVPPGAKPGESLVIRSLSLGCARARSFSVHVRPPPRDDACGCLACDGVDMHMHTGAAYACRAQRPSMPKGPSSQPRRGGAYTPTYKPARG